MSIAITCPCGRTYTKPDHKVGSSFRCHLCGRELTIAAQAAVEGIALAPLSEPHAAQPTIWESERGTAAPSRSSPPPASGLRTTLAWILIFLGLAGIVGGIGMIYIDSMIEKAEREDAQAKAAMFGPIWDPHPPRKKDTQLPYAISGCSIVLGLALTYTGFRVRK